MSRERDATTETRPGISVCFTLMSTGGEADFLEIREQTFLWAAVTWTGERREAQEKREARRYQNCGSFLPQKQWVSPVYAAVPESCPPRRENDGFKADGLLTQQVT